MAFIMDQVNGPQYKVLTNMKFVGKNKEEVIEHILLTRSTINEEDPDVSSTLVGSK